MKTTQFKNFRDYVTTASNEDPIWWAGYMWIDLTEKQSTEMFDVLVKKGMGRLDTDGKPFVQMPSGLRLNK